MDRTLLYRYGIDYDTGLSRCMDDVAFYDMLLSLFLEDNCFARAKTAHAAGDFPTLFNCLHELKGVSANAALAELYEAVCPLVDLLRDGAAMAQQVDPLFEAVQNAWQRTCEGISLAAAR